MKIKNPAMKCYHSEHWTWDLNHLYLMLFSLSYWGRSYLAHLRSSYGQALLVVTKWSKSKIEMVLYKRQFRDILSSTCLDSSERRILDLNEWGPRCNNHWGNILFLDCFLFSCSKTSDVNYAIIVNSVCLRRN